MSTKCRVVCVVLLLPFSVAFGTQFGQIPASQVIGSPSVTNDTNVTLTLSGTPTDSLLKPFSLTLGWAGTLATSRGGTGNTLGAEPPLGNPSTDGYILSSTAAGVRSWIVPPSGGGGAVSSVFTRTGAVVAQTGDYIFSQIGSTPITLSGYGITDAQPLDSDLTAIAALSTTSFGRGGLTQADAASFRSYIGAGTSSVTPAALTKTDDTNVTLTLGGTPATALLQATSITLGWAGQLSIARGGTNASTASAALSNLGGEPSLGFPSADGYILSSTTGGVRTWIAPGGGGGVASITGTSPITVSPTTGAAVASLNVGVDHAFTAAQSIKASDSATSTVTFPLTFGHNTSGTPLANYGTGMKVQAEDSTTADITIGSMQWIWTTPTHNVQDSSVLINADSGGTLDRTVARFSGAGGLTVGPSTTTDQAAGVISAETGYRIGNLAAASGAILQGNGTNYIKSTPTWPTSAGTANKVVKSNGTNLLMSVETYATPSTAGNIMTSDGTNWTSTPKATAQAVPANPATTTNTTGVMCGLSGSITTSAATSGRILIIISGYCNNNTASDGIKVQIRHGTGAAPTNGAALTGTADGNFTALINGAQTFTTPFSTQAIVTGLSASTAYWIDLSQAAITGGTASVLNPNISAVEL